MRFYLSFAALLFLSFCFAGSLAASWTANYNYDPSATTPNPLKGFFNFYSGTDEESAVFPNSLEIALLPMNQIMTGPNTFNWTTMETTFTNIAARKHHAVPRIYVDYPGLALAVPSYLLNGLKLYSGEGGQFPDYNNQTLINAIVQMIQAIAARYDGDNRIGVWQVGILGHWGEWHVYPDNQTAWASPAIQDQVLGAFNTSFVKTKFVIRNPSLSGTKNVTTWNAGFHDDSFAEDSYGCPWCFLEAMQNTGSTNQWKTQMIGPGEVRPELQKCLFTANPASCCQNVGGGCGDTIPLDFNQSMNSSHVSSLLNYYAFDPGFTGDDYNRGLDFSQRMGYLFYISKISLNEAVAADHINANISITMTNKGLAPFYYPLHFVIRVIYANGTLLATSNISVPISSQLPLEQHVYSTSLNLPFNTTVSSQLYLDSWILNGRPIIFAVNGATTDGMIRSANFTTSSSSDGTSSGDADGEDGADSAGSYIYLCVLLMILAVFC